MNMPRTARSIVLAGLGLFMLAGPMAFQQECGMADCCCQPEATDGISLEKTPCCGCQVSAMAQLPIQPAMAQSAGVPDHIRIETPAAITGEIEITNGNNLSYRFFETQSLSPPLSIGSINIPLIC
jgi:hypothetical protein